MKAVILRWLPHSGKSTIAKVYEDNWYEIVTREKVSKRYWLDGTLNNVLYARSKQYRQELAMQKKDIIIDGCNCNGKHVQKLIIELTELGYTTSVIDVFQNLMEQYWGSVKEAFNHCLRIREKKEKKVPLSIMNKLLFQYGLNNIWGKAILVDLDNCLYNVDKRIMNCKDEKWLIDWGRMNSYEEISNDYINSKTYDVIKDEPHKIILTTRMMQAEPATLRKLKEDGIDFDAILMREGKGKYKEVSIKEIWVKMLKYAGVEIAYAVDDNPECIEMYKRLGVAVVDTKKL